MDNSKKEWLRTEVKDLIQEYKRQPNLWNVKHSEYHNRIKKKEGFLELAKKFDTTKEEIVRKLHNLKNQFNSEYKKEKTKSGQGTDEIYVSKWPYFSTLKFLTVTMETRNVSDISSVSKDDNEEENDQWQMETITPTTVTEMTLSPKGKKNTQTDNKELYRKAVNTLTSEEDEFDVFGAHVANELRCLRNEVLVRLLKKKIQLAIIEVNDMVI